MCLTTRKSGAHLNAFGIVADPIGQAKKVFGRENAQTHRYDRENEFDTLFAWWIL